MSLNSYTNNSVDAQTEEKDEDENLWYAKCFAFFSFKNN